MKLKIYQIDAFADELFCGNPAAIVPLDDWIDESLMQKIAEENNLSETAFFIKKNDFYFIRWFTPTTEVDLCGHATLAAGYMIFNFINKESNEILFNSKSGQLKVIKDGDLITLDFPSVKPISKNMTDSVISCFTRKPIEYLAGNFDFVVFDSEYFIKNYQPQIDDLKKLNKHGVIITAKSERVDFVSRVFVPNEGIDEDPVTGSAHTMLVPYWSEKLNKNILIAEQVSKRGGKLWLENLEDRVLISGKAKLFMIGEIYI